MVPRKMGDVHRITVLRGQSKVPTHCATREAEQSDGEREDASTLAKHDRPLETIDASLHWI
jgi:hypothetical protein